MNERMIWIKGFVPRTAPKPKAPYAEIDFPVTVEDVDPAEVSAVASVTMPRERWHGGGELAVEVVEHAGKLWRPVMFTKHREEDTLTAEEVLARNDDNPVAAVARRHRRQHADEHTAAGTENPELRAALADDIAKAAARVCIIDGVAYRECHEPTWIVTEARFMTSGILLQPYLGVPGRTRGTAWFSHDHLDEAEAFAAELAAEKETEVLRLGDIVFSGPAGPRFDDVVFAEDRLIEAFVGNVRNLWRVLPGETADTAERAWQMAECDRPAAVDAALTVASSLALVEGDPAVEALLSSSKISVSQVDFFQRNSVFARDAEEALDSIRP